MNPAKKGLGRGLSALFGDIEKKGDPKKNGAVDNPDFMKRVYFEN